MHLLVIGNFDVDEVLQVVKKYDLVSPHSSVELERFPVEKNEVRLNQSCRMEVATRSWQLEFEEMISLRKRKNFVIN